MSQTSLATPLAARLPSASPMHRTAREARLKVLDLVFQAQTSHIGSNFSCIDILTAVFSRFDWQSDKFVLSAGWKAASLYYFLWKSDRITLEELNSFCKDGSKFIGLAEPVTADIPISGGSMGLGFPGAVGLALAKKIKGERGRIYCLVSDGEMQSGTTWESALIAARHGLCSLTVIVDNNGLQAMGAISDILPLNGPSAFPGWRVAHVDGHDFEALDRELAIAAPAPTVIFAQTIKGKGVSFMEGNNLYHYKQLSDEEYTKAKAEL